MHDDLSADDYAWPTCVACGHDLWADETNRWACRPCEDRTRKRLGELPSLFARLNTTAALMRGARKSGATTSGSRMPPIPPRLEVLDLAAAGGVATRLQAVEDSWRKAFGRRIEVPTDGVRIFASWRSHPATAVPGHVAFLTINLERACETYDSVGQDVEEIRRLHAEVTQALSGQLRPGRVKVGLCPVVLDGGGRCGQQLTATTANHRIRCAGCGAEWADMPAWRELRRAQEAMLVDLAGIAA